MAIAELPIFNFFDQQRFKQFNPMDCANWYIQQNKNSKKGSALYPTMGRAHINFLNENRLIFNAEPRAIFRSLDFFYVIVGARVYKIDQFFNQVNLVNFDFSTTAGFLDFDYLPVTQIPGGMTPNYQRTFCMLTDGVHCYVIDESTNTMTTVTDSNAPVKPRYVAAFGNRFAVSAENSTQFNLTQINLGSVFNPADVFTVSSNALFAQEVGIIRQMGVLHNQLYIFSDFRTGVWSNSPSSISTATGADLFPWRRNTSLEFDVGMADDTSLAIGFDMMCWLAQNRQGTTDFVVTQGQNPVEFSTDAVNVLLQRAINDTQLIPLLTANSNGFLYQYENTVFYRISAGQYHSFGDIDIQDTADSLEYNFTTKTWSRCIELNGERCRIQQHVYFKTRHLVTVLDEGTIYEMGGQFYTNELRNADEPDPQAADAYIQYPFRYENVTPIISQPEYSEFETRFVQIDMVWGVNSFIRFDSSGFNYSDLNSPIYNTWLKPSIELFFSDDGGVSFLSADKVEFSQLGTYSWRMRWYQLGVSRNRVYKLVCVSSCPIVILGAIMDVENVSGGAY